MISSSVPPTPITSREPIVASAAWPSVSAIVAAPISAAPDQNNARRPTAASIRPETRPASTLPAANAATCRPPTE